MTRFTQSLLAAALVTLGGAAQAQQTIATLPSDWEGTYNLTFSANADASTELLPTGTQVAAVFTADGTLCIADHLLTNPVVESSSTAEANYRVPALGLQLMVSNINGNFNEINVLTEVDGTDADAEFLGQFTGSKTSTDTTCGALGSTPPDMSKIAELIELAEEQYASLFPAMTTAGAFQIIDGYVARGYASTGIHIGIKDGTVYVVGGEFGNSPVSIGTIANTIAQLTGGTPDVEEPVVEIPEGDFDLTIAGTVTSSVFGNNTTSDFSLTIEDIPAPDDVTIDNLEDEVKEALDDAEGVDASTFTDFQISDVSTSNDRVFFRAQFAATTQSNGITVNMSYNLTYEYIRQ